MNSVIHGYVNIFSKTVCGWKGGGYKVRLCFKKALANHTCSLQITFNSKVLMIKMTFCYWIGLEVNLPNCRVIIRFLWFLNSLLNWIARFFQKTSWHRFYIRNISIVFLVSDYMATPLFSGSFFILCFIIAVDSFTVRKYFPVYVVIYLSSLM